MEKDRLQENINIQKYKETHILVYNKHLGTKKRNFLRTLSDSLIKSGLGLTLGIIILIFLQADFIFYPLFSLLAMIFGFGYPIIKETNRNKIEIYIDEKNLYIPKQISYINLSEIIDIHSRKEKLDNDLFNVIIIIKKRNGKEDSFFLNEVNNDEIDIIVTFVKNTIEKNKINLPPVMDNNQNED